MRARTTWFLTALLNAGLIAAGGCASAQLQQIPPGDRPIRAGTLEIYVADTANNRLVRVNDMTGAGWTTLGGPTAGDHHGQFNLPSGVNAVVGPLLTGQQPHIYVADKLNARVVQFDNMNGDNWVTRAVGEGHHPLRIFYNGALFITADPNLVLRLADINDASPTILVGSTVRSALTPNGFAWASGGGGLFVDWHQTLLLATTQYALKISGWPATNPTPNADACCADAASQLMQPKGIALDAAGRIYIADTGHHRIVRINNIFGDGFIALGGPAAGSGVGQFNQPMSVTVHDGKIYVADTYNDRIVRLDDLVESNGVVTSTGWTVLHGVLCQRTLPGGLPLPPDPPTLPGPIKPRWCDTFSRPEDLSVVTRL